MRIPFIKMQAQGNDFIILQSEGITLDSLQYQALALDICDRHFGLGADGLVILDKREPAMVIYNADGSRAEMCGSALRCCSTLLARQTGSMEQIIKTDNGNLRCTCSDLETGYSSVEIGKPVLVEKDLTINGVTGDYINVGNPHFVIFTPDSNLLPHLKVASQLAEHKYFVNGVNVEYVYRESESHIQLIVWERGVGPTLACGTGATAAVFSGYNRQLLAGLIQVQLPGGSVTICRDGASYYLGGVTDLVAEGEFLWKA